MYISVACLTHHENKINPVDYAHTLWRHQMETFSALLAICAGNSPVPGEFPTKRPVTRRFGVFHDLRPNKRLSKQSWGWWSETPSRSLWRHRNGSRFIVFFVVRCRSILPISFRFTSMALQLSCDCRVPVGQPLDWWKNTKNTNMYMSQGPYY